MPEPPSYAGSLYDPSIRLLRQLEATFSDERYQPPRVPRVALELMELAKQPSVAFNGIVQVLETDALLAAEVLRLAQSPAFVRKVPPRTLAAAVSRLGLKAIQGLVWQSAMNGKVFKSRRFSSSLEEVRRHSIAVAHIARSIAAAGHQGGDDAFLAGLLHDVGVSAILLAAADIEGSAGFDVALVAEVVEELHPTAGAVVARLWNLPPELQLAIAGHHDVTESSHPLVAIVTVAASVATQLGYGVHVGAALTDRTVPMVLDAAMARIGLAPDAYAALVHRGRELLAQVDMG